MSFCPRFFRRMPGHLVAPASCVVLAGLLAIAPTARADDAAPEFNPSANVAGSRWAYGWTPTRGGAFTLFTTKGTDGFGLDYWNHAASQTLVSHNATGLAKNIGNSTTIPPGGLTIYPGSTDQYSVVRWTATVAGTYTVVARFIRRSTNAYAAADVAVLHDNAVVYSRWLTNDVTPVVSMSATLTVAAGAHVDFAVGPGDVGNSSDMIGLEATVSLEPVATSAGPVVFFGGQRFVACHGDSAFESIAYDPVNQRIASRDIIRTRCGTPVFQGTEEHPGLTWDPVTGSYWQVTNARVVRRWSANGAFLGNVFTVPPTFTVPGWGLDTLDAVKGIAVDSNFVYLVDAGIAGAQGEIYSNEWFKFTRAGAPVKSSKTTNFHAHLDLSPDAIVDDIVYSPFSSPVFPGKLLIALEHSGIQVIDAEGNFVAKFRWTDTGVPPGLRLAAFAGLTLDPVSGNLYLVDNDGSTTQVWTRLPSGGATSYVVGTGSNPPYLHYPNPGCNRALWKSLPGAAGLVFGSAYRASNQTVYGIDFSGGDLWRFHPASAAGGRVSLTGAYSVWGLASDTERDVLYAGMETGGNDVRILVVDPVTGAVSPLPGMVGGYTRDLAFHPGDRKIYGVADIGGGPKLVRIDRDTGVGTVVGPTPSVAGLDYDAATGRIIGIPSSGPPTTLFSIDPADGSSTALASLPVSRAWEGLSVVPVPATPLLAAERAPAAEAASLRVSPNPARGAVTLAFSLPTEAEVETAVFDVSGRKVVSLGQRRFTAGTHAVRWDGRDGDGRIVPNGVYFVRLDRAGQSLVTRVVRIE